MRRRKYGRIRVLGVVVLAAAIVGCAAHGPEQAVVAESPPNELHFEGSGGRYLRYELSDTDWKYRYWIRDLGEKLYEAWIPPYAYSIGIVDGSARFRFRVERDGEIVGLQLVDHVGHTSLMDASLDCLVVVGAALPLPEELGAESLEVELEFVYP
ncbi:MAG: hypothetical protein R3D98_10875 [Candidatus Krumholzibacteriia bacterium]